MIVLKEIKKIYQAKNSPQVIALKNINLTLEDQGLVFITGKSGCGKSTLLNILGGLDSPTSGAIYIQNQNMNHWNDKELDSYRNSYVGFIFQEFHVLNAYNVYDNIRLAKELKQEKISDQELDAYLDKVSLTGLGKRKMNELSGGQKQRVALLRALVKKPYLILADEPTGNLDTYNSDIIFKLLKEISKTKLVIVVTHDVESALKYGDRLIELKDGSIIKDTCPPQKKTTLPYTLKKSHLPIPYATKLAWNNLKQYPKKCICTIVLFLVSLLCFIFLINSSLFSNTSLAIKLMHINESYNLQIEKINYIENTKTVAEWTDEDKTFLNNLYPNPTNEIYELYDFQSPLTFALNNPDASDKLYSWVPTITSYVEIKDPQILSNLYGEIPKNSREIVIHEYLANYIMKYGIKEKNGSWIPETEEELISKTHPIYLGDNEVYISGILKEDTSYTEESLEEENTDTAYQNYTKKSKTVYVKGFTKTVSLNQTQTSTLEQFYLAMNNDPFTINESLKEEEILLTIDALINSNSTLQEVYQSFIETNPASTEEETTTYLNEYLSTHRVECNIFFRDFLNNRSIPITRKVIGVSKENSLSSALVNKYISTGKRKIGVLIHEENDKNLKELLPHLNFQVTFLNAGENPYEVSSDIIDITNNASTLYETFRKVISFLALAFTVFTFLLLLNMVDDTIRYSKKEIGILRAIGTSKKDICKIFALETLMITVLSILLSFLAWFILVFFINQKYSKLYSMKALILYTSIYTPLITIIFAIGISLCITLLALEKRNKNNPINLINNQKN